MSDEAFLDMKAILIYLNEDRLKTGMANYKYLIHALSTSTTDFTYHNSLCTYLKSAGLVNYKMVNGYYLVQITEKAFNSINDPQFFGKLYSLEREPNFTEINNSIPAKKPKEKASQVIKRIWSFKVIRWIVYISPIFISPSRKIAEFAFEEVVLKPLSIKYKIDTLLFNSPSNDSTKLIPKKKAAAKISKPGSINKKFVHT